jgi:hypothetical protein
VLHCCQLSLASLPCPRGVQRRGDSEKRRLSGRHRSVAPAVEAAVDQTFRILPTLAVGRLTSPLRRSQFPAASSARRTIVRAGLLAPLTVDLLRAHSGEIGTNLVLLEGAFQLTRP